MKNKLGLKIFAFASFSTLKINLEWKVFEKKLWVDLFTTDSFRGEWNGDENCFSAYSAKNIKEMLCYHWKTHVHHFNQFRCWLDGWGDFQEGWLSSKLLHLLKPHHHHRQHSCHHENKNFRQTSSPFSSSYDVHHHKPPYNTYNTPYHHCCHIYHHHTHRVRSYIENLRLCQQAIGRWC